MLGFVRRLVRRVLGFLRGPAPIEPDEVRAAVAGTEPPRRQWSLPAWLVALRTRLFVNAALAGAVAFGALAWLVSGGQTAAADLALTQGIQTVEHPLLALLMAGVSEFGFPPLSLVVVLGTAAVLLLLGSPLAASAAVAGGGAALLAQPFKLLLARPRPDEEAVRVASELSDFSFPSGHTLFYVGFFGFLFYLAYTRLRRGRLRTLLLWSLGALVLLVGPSRVYLGHHWPSDVLASYALGLAYLVLLVRWYARRALPTAVVAPSSA